MDPGFLLIDNFARLVAVLGILISTPLFAWAGYLWMTSMGDPNRAAAARNAFISVGIGLVIIGCAFIIPAVIGESVVAPAGGLVYEQDNGVSTATGSSGSNWWPTGRPPTRSGSISSSSGYRPNSKTALISSGPRWLVLMLAT